MQGDSGPPLKNQRGRKRSAPEKKTPRRVSFKEAAEHEEGEGEQGDTDGGENTEWVKSDPKFHGKSYSDLKKLLRQSATQQAKPSANPEAS